MFKTIECFVLRHYWPPFKFSAMRQNSCFRDNSAFLTLDVCPRALFLCLQHCLGGRRNALAGFNPVQVLGFAFFFFFPFELRVPLLLLLQQTEGAPDKRSIANAGCWKHICPLIPEKLSIIFSKSMEMVWFILWAERCQKCSACLWMCTRHPQGCTQNSWGTRGQHSGVHSTALSTHRTNGICCCDQHLVSLLHIFCPQHCPPAYGVSIQKTDLLLFKSLWGGQVSLLFDVQVLELLMGEDSSVSAFNWLSLTKKKFQYWLLESHTQNHSVQF